MLHRRPGAESGAVQTTHQFPRESKAPTSVVGAFVVPGEGAPSRDLPAAAAREVRRSTRS